LLFGAVAAIALLTSIGCVGSRCDREGQAPQRFEGGRTNSDGSFYESSGLEGPFLFFPSGRTYHLVHGLSEAPAEFNVFLSFAEHPLETGAGIAPSAGNQSIIEDVNDQYIELRNDTCAEVFVRLTARTAPFGAGGGEATGDARAATDAPAANSRTEAGMATADGGTTAN
jgi:hypothetical protein